MAMASLLSPRYYSSLGLCHRSLPVQPLQQASLQSNKRPLSRFSSSSSSSSFNSPSPGPLRASPPKQESSSALDVSVFRFTLGIPGFDDADLPKVIGVFVGAVLLLNHFLSRDSVITPAQWRSEVVGLCSAIVSINLPLIGRILNGKTSSLNAEKVAPKSSQVFVLEKNLSPQDKEDIAWASYVLLKNTKATSLAIWNGKMLCARGYWDIPKGNEGDDLQRLEETLMKTSPFPCSTLTYIPSKADEQGLNVLFNGVACALVLPYTRKEKNSFILLLSSIPDAFTGNDVIWAEMLLEKLFGLDVKNDEP